MGPQLLVDRPTLTKRQERDLKTARRHRQQKQKQDFLTAAQRAREQDRVALNISGGLPNTSATGPAALNTDDTPTNSEQLAAVPVPYNYVQVHTSADFWPHERKDEITAFEAGVEVTTAKKPEWRDSGIIVDFDSPSAKDVAAPTRPTFENGDLPAYSLINEPLFANVPLFGRPSRTSTPESPEYEDITDELIGVQRVTKIYSSGTISYLRITGPNEQADKYPSLRLHNLSTSKYAKKWPNNEVSPSKVPGMLPKRAAESAEALHLRNHGVPLNSPDAHWYLGLGSKGCPLASKHLPGQKHFCTCTHQEYTNLAHAEFKRKQRRQAKEESTRKRKRERDERGANAALLVGAEGEMDVCSGGGKRQRKMTARARGEE